MTREVGYLSTSFFVSWWPWFNNHDHFSFTTLKFLIKAAFASYVLLGAIKREE
jgi:hypothetical protein